MKTKLIFPDQPAVENVHTPIVYTKEELAWEYKHLTRKLNDEALLSEAQLNVLGGEGWELAGIFEAGSSVHFYFKRVLRK